jgi:hypothetical protein
MIAHYSRAPSISSVRPAVRQPKETWHLNSPGILLIQLSPYHYSKKPNTVGKNDPSTVN